MLTRRDMPLGSVAAGGLLGLSGARVGALFTPPVPVSALDLEPWPRTALVRIESHAAGIPPRRTGQVTAREGAEAMMRPDREYCVECYESYKPDNGNTEVCPHCGSAVCWRCSWKHEKVCGKAARKEVSAPEEAR